MVAPPSPTPSAPSSSPCSCSCPVTSVAAHRRRLPDAPVAADRSGGAARARALFFARRASGKRAAGVVDQAWARNAVACLLGAAVVVGLVTTTSRRGAVVGAGMGSRLVRRAVPAEALRLGEEENLAAVARRPPDDDPPPPVRSLALLSIAVID